MILKGRMLANAFLREFSTLDLSDDDQDPATRFPWNRCPDGTLPSDANFCWIDYRDESVMSSSELCTNDSSGNTGSSIDASWSVGMIRQGLGMILGTVIGLLLFV